MSGNPAVLVTSNVYPAFKFLLEFVITFSMTEKALNNSFQTANKFLGASNTRPHWVVFNGKTQHLPLAIRKFLGY